jgi:hypothetical protein
MLKDLRSILLRYAGVIEEEKKGNLNAAAKKNLEFATKHA